jgi:GT2 family glycosyltransferase
MTYSSQDITIAIPTYGRDDVLVDTVRFCLEQVEPAGELLVLDQTVQHSDKTTQVLSEWQQQGKICWERLERPSQPAAMNVALQRARRPLLLFLDDDIIPAEGFIAAHARAHATNSRDVVVGQVIQPWQQPGEVPIPHNSRKLTADLQFPFHSNQPAVICNVMSGHMSVARDFAVELGGFDENFFGAAYRFDTEFGRRVNRAGGQVRFEPSASIRHLRAERGGTRVQGNHLASASPMHGVGDYYFALLQGIDAEVLGYCGYRLVREVCTRFHLKHPWYIPVKLLGEVRALLWAIQLKAQGQALLKPPMPTT